MPDFETEEQQVEALKKWFSENAFSLFLGVGIGVAGLFGWRYYVDHENTHHTQASEIYQTVTQQLSNKTAADNVAEHVEKLVSEYPDTPYASLASLALARQALQNNDVDEAVSRLEWAAGNADQAEIQHLSSLRLARVLIAQEKYQDAEKLLQQPHPESFNVLYEELKGDLYVAMGDHDSARLAYDSAIEHSGLNVDRWLRLKRTDLGAGDKSSADTLTDPGELPAQ